MEVSTGLKTVTLQAGDAVLVFHKAEGECRVECGFHDEDNDELHGEDSPAFLLTVCVNMLGAPLLRMMCEMHTRRNLNNRED